MVSIVLPQIEVIYKDVFNMKHMYSVMHLYLEEDRWEGMVGDYHNFIETYYLDRKLVPREIRFWWRCKRLDKNPGATGSWAYEHILDIYCNIINMVDIEIVKEGRKMKVQNGEISIKLNARIEVKDFEKHPILKFVDHFFRHRIYKHELEMQKKILYRDLYKFEGMIKKYLELRIFTPEFEIFHEKFDNM